MNIKNAFTTSLFCTSFVLFLYVLYISDNGTELHVTFGMPEKNSIIPDKHLIFPENHSVLLNNNSAILDKYSISLDKHTLMPDSHSILPDKSSDVSDNHTIMPDKHSFLPDKIPIVSSKQLSKEWLLTPDAYPSCNETSASSSDGYDLKTHNFSCNLSSLFHYDIHRKVFGVNIDVLGLEKVACPRNISVAAYYVPRTALVSYPGSGNTWTRHLLQQLTGIQSGAVYFDPVLLSNGFPGEGLLSGVIAVKTHNLKEFDTYNFTKQILILRNPFDAFVAEYKRSRLDARHSGKTDIIPNEIWEDYVEHRARRWTNFISACLKYQIPQLIVLYEDMKACLLRELLRMSAFLSTPNLTSFSVCCALTNSEGNYYRKQGRAPLYSLYSSQLRNIMNDKLSFLAADISQRFPVLANRLLEYRLF